jgi:hypothetical protein
VRKDTDCGCEIRAPRKILRHKREKVACEDYHNLYSSLNITEVTKSRRIGWADHVARMGEMRYA